MGLDMKEAPLPVSLYISCHWHTSSYCPFSGSSNLYSPPSFPPWRPCQNVLHALHQTPSITGQGKPYPVSSVLTPIHCPCHPTLFHSIPTQHWCRYIDGRIDYLLNVWSPHSCSLHKGTSDSLPPLSGGQCGALTL